MGIMSFGAQPIPEVVEFIKKHYKGGSILDYGCGSGRYADCFPNKDYLGVDGHHGNISFCIPNFPNKKFIKKDLETWRPKKKFDYLFSSVTFDQIDNLPLDWADKYILIENRKYKYKFNVLVDEPLQGSEETRLMVCTKL